ncbi:cupin domain-containing protein [Streptomyces sp. NPDC015127]|uniref:cupin domain-containing protein n=1 Tax=Streptomyces sp. NPDC015127 TaxID=3364939 RepID=UPI0037021523
MSAPQLPAGIGMSRVNVYESAGPDGLRGGTPHMHLICTEMYVGLSGQGTAEFIDSSGYHRYSLGPGDAFVFTPGTVHRLVSDDALTVLVVMENDWLAELGDAVFPFAASGDDKDYATLACAGTEMSVRQRRDAAVLGFNQLADSWRQGDTDTARHQLRAFYTEAARRQHAQGTHWAATVAQGTMAVALDALHARAAAVDEADPKLLRPGRVTPLPPSPTPPAIPGMCGMRRPYLNTPLHDRLLGQSSASEPI